MAPVVEQHTVARKQADRLLNKWAVERETSLDITTIYRRMKVGTFPQPVRVGKRRVAWRESDIAAWQASLDVGTR
jgi:prophage regulatory protein